MVSKWDNRYMELARSVGSWSKDPSTKIGCIAVGEGGNILSTGYNGFPKGIADDHRLEDRETKYKIIVHAEMNAIYNATLNGVSLKGSTMYVSGLPCCSECAKGVIQSGVKRVIMTKADRDNPRWKDSFDLTYDMFDEAVIEYDFI